MASKQLLMLPNAPLDISPDPAFETASESFICLYGPDTVITSPDITVSSIRITEVTDTMIGQFKPEISSMNTFRIDYDYAHGTKVQVCLSRHDSRILAPLRSVRPTTFSTKRQRGVPKSTRRGTSGRSRSYAILTRNSKPDVQAEPMRPLSVSTAPIASSPQRMSRSRTSKSPRKNVDSSEAGGG